MIDDLRVEAYASLKAIADGLTVHRIPVVPRTAVASALFQLANELLVDVRLAGQTRTQLAEHARRLYVALARPLDHDTKCAMDWKCSQELADRRLEEDR